MFTINNVLKQSSFDGIEAHINVRIGECSEAPYLGILIEVQDHLKQIPIVALMVFMMQINGCNANSSTITANTRKDLQCQLIFTLRSD